MYIVGESYKRFISLFLDAGYRAVKFLDENLTSTAMIILRHDVDWSVEAAVKVAKWNIELGIFSTFFFLLNSDFYNIFSQRNYEQIVQIAMMGHTVALHLEKGFCEIPEFAQKTYNIFYDWLSFADKRIISNHRPSHLTPQNALLNICKSTYDDKFIKEIKYFSDSGCTWRHYPFDSIEFKEKKSIQMLLHPIWWVYEGSNAAIKFKKFLAERKCILQSEIQNSFSAKIDWNI